MRQAWKDSRRNQSKTKSKICHLFLPMWSYQELAVVVKLEGYPRAMDRLEHSSVLIGAE